MSPDTATRELTADPLAGYASPLQIRPFRDGDEAAWEHYVARAPQATFFHRAGWLRVVAGALGHEAHYRCAWRNGRIVGILPLVHVKSRLFGGALISTAFTTGGGIAADDDAAAQALADEAGRIGERLGVDFVELRHGAPLPLGDAWLAKTELYFGFERAIAATAADNLKAIPRKKRADLRKAIDDKRLAIDAAAPVETFFRIYSGSLRNLGTPVLPLRFYAAIKAEFGDAVEISTVSGPDGPATALMSFFFKDRVLPYYGGAVPAARRLHAYDVMYWALMQRAAAGGVRVFDFGRSKRGTGSFDYKTYWGFAPQPLGYQYRLVERTDLPEINPLNPKYRLMVGTWRRLPLALANRLGPLVARQIG
ncbi:MAG: FemAB family PEP-CTERM system-associated protein [Alphaproteobacteria bacterium]|nr:FemAB family PEP-CTERM system-associated protein [Alphaproteobacteria bacterium]